MRRRRLCALILAAAIATSASAQADEGDPFTGTLKTIQARGTILIGYRDSAPPFAFLNPSNQPVGFSIDLCHGIAEDIARALHRDLLEPDAPAWQTGVRIIFVPVAPADRLPKIVTGGIDLECGSTTATAERAKTIAFSPMFFLAGTKLLVPLADGQPTVTSYEALAGHTVIVGAGTTNAALLHRLAMTVSPPITVTEVANLDTAYDLLAAGKADAFASDDTLLAGFIATRPDGKRFSIVGDYLSYEPYAIGYRRDDLDFATLVRESFNRMAADGTLNQRYGHWLTDQLPNGDRMNMPISPHLLEMYRALGQPN